MELLNSGYVKVRCSDFLLFLGVILQFCLKILSFKKLSSEILLNFD